MGDALYEQLATLPTAENTPEQEEKHHSNKSKVTKTNKGRRRAAGTTKAPKKTALEKWLRAPKNSYKSYLAKKAVMSSHANVQKAKVKAQERIQELEEANESMVPRCESDQATM